MCGLLLACGRVVLRLLLKVLLCLNPPNLYVKRCATQSAWGNRAAEYSAHARILYVVLSDGSYGISEKTTDDIVPQVKFLPGLRMLIPQEMEVKVLEFCVGNLVLIFTSGWMMAAAYFSQSRRLLKATEAGLTTICLTSLQVRNLMTVCINFIRERRYLHFNVDSEQQIFRKFFSWPIYFTLRVFARNLLSWNRWRNIFLFPVSIWYLSWGTNPGCMPNKPTRYLPWRFTSRTRCWIFV